MPRPVPRHASPTFPFAALFSLALFALAALTPLRAAPWAVADSDLPPHPKLHTGTLPNGLRYLVFPNPEPKDRISLRLVVSVGALHENDDELGLAHFVEHMAFRATRSHPAGSLTSALQRLGVGLGPDTGAFTFPDYTVYHLELPDTQDATLRNGLNVLREFAEEITFDRKLIETERGVILNEIVTRDKPEARVGLANLWFLWPESPHVRRPVGGSAQTIRRFTRDRFVAFYDAWYRPERMAVIVVGDIAADAAERLIVDKLGRLAPRGAPRPEPQRAVERASKPDVFIHADPALVGVQLTFQHPFAVPRRDTREQRIEQLHRSLAIAMFHNRLRRLSAEPGASFVAPAASISFAFPGWQVANFSVNGRIDDWRQVAADLEREHRRAFQFGFTAGELEEGRRSFAAGYAQSVESAATWPSFVIAQHLVASLVYGTVFSAPDVVQRDMAEPLARATSQDCLAAFQATWTTAAPHVFISAHPAFAITRAQIAEALNEGRKAAVTAYAEKADAGARPFAYSEFGPPGTLAHDEHLPDLDVRLARFENGVRFNFKSTNFAAGEIEIRVRVGEGKLTLRQHQPGLDLLANFMVTAGGLGRHTAQELSRILAGTTVSLGFNVDTDACLFTARCAPRDLALTLQVISAFLGDAAYRPEAMRDAHASFTGMYSALAASPGGPISLHALRALSAGDRRFGLPLYEELFSRTVDELKAWLDPQLKRGAIEMSIAGEVGWPEALAAVSATLGSLPPREPRRADVDRDVKIPAPPKLVRAYDIDPALRQVALAWYWPMPGLADIHQERRCRLLAAILDDRIRMRIREQLGAAYSTSGSFEETHAFPGLNYFVVYAEVAPQHAAKAMEIIEREATSLMKKGVQADEFVRSHRPFIRARADDLRLNSYWGGTVLSDAQHYPDRLAAARDRTTDTAAITAAELTALAKLHLNPSKSFRFATLPRRPAPGRPSTPNSTAAGNTAAQPP